MNSNLNRALTAAIVAFGGVAPALAQTTNAFDWDSVCLDPNNTAPYSTNFGILFQRNPLFGASIGVSGSATYSSTCDGGTAITGRIGFTIGTQGSIQDNDPNSNAKFGTLIDDNLRLTLGANFFQQPGLGSYVGPYLTPASGGNSYARVYQTTTTGTPATTSYLYGGTGLSLAYAPRSGRSIITEANLNAGAIRARCQISVLADAARVNWTLTNETTTPLGLGLYFGQVVALTNEGALSVPGNLGFPGYQVPYGTGDNAFFTDYITVPGRKPLTVDESFPGDVTATVPPYVNFSMSQAAGFGLQVVNDPSALNMFDPLNGSDQTPVDEFEIGTAATGFLVDGHFNTADPVFADGLINPPGNGNGDAAALTGRFGFPGYVQRWEPTDGASLTPVGGSRNIVAYYRSTNFDSNYSPEFQGYAVAVDTPKSISTVAGTSGTQTPNPFIIRVNVDNTGGFSLTDTFVSMQNVVVQLSLPDGMQALDANGNPVGRLATQTITRIYNDLDSSRPPTTVPALSIGYVDFRVQVASRVYGSQTYTAVVTPGTGFLPKTVTGNINIAATPQLLVQSGANLVGSPWQYSDSLWETVLGLRLNNDFQSYTWDSQLQQYIPQSSAERGIGTWIVSSADHGYVPLAGGPNQPTDQFPSAVNYDNGGYSAPITLHRGWNLIANPYNFAFPVGQLVGIPTGGQQALQFTDLVNQGYFDGSFAYYDPSQRRYLFLTGDASTRLQPNLGYWVYANFDFQVQFPPIYETFVRSAPPAVFKQRFDNWKLQMSASVPNSTDSENYMGIVRDPSSVKKLSVRKAPMPPVQSKLDTLRASVSNGSTDMAQLVRYARGAQTFAYNVYTKTAGPVTVSWPNLSSLPTNLAVSVTDPVTKKTVNARTASNYSFSSSAQAIRQFTVKVTPQGTVAQRVSSASTAIVRKGNVNLMQIAYLVSGRGGATLKVYQGSRLVGTVADDVDVVAGTNTLLWPMTGLSGTPLPNGNYTLQIAATGEGGDTSSKTFAITVRH